MASVLLFRQSEEVACRSAHVGADNRALLRRLVAAFGARAPRALRKALAWLDGTFWQPP